MNGREFTFDFGWSDDYFNSDYNGNLSVSSYVTKHKDLPLKDIVDNLIENNISLPFLLRFPDIIKNRIEKIFSAFDKEISDFGINSSYGLVYPIKVNQNRLVIDTIFQSKFSNRIGLESGSKSELAICLNYINASVIICNGYKDREYIYSALLAQKHGYNIILNVDRLDELKVIIDESIKLNIRPKIGLRLKLECIKDINYSNDKEYLKFGLYIYELAHAIDYIKSFKMNDIVTLIHFHVGTQIENLSVLEQSIREISKIYMMLQNDDISIDTIDIGGGASVSYNEKTNVSYSIYDYSRVIVSSLIDSIDKRYKMPNIISESGRYITAHHALIIT